MGYYLGLFWAAVLLITFPLEMSFFSFLRDVAVLVNTAIARLVSVKLFLCFIHVLLNIWMIEGWFYDVFKLETESVPEVRKRLRKSAIGKILFHIGKSPSEGNLKRAVKQLGGLEGMGAAPEKFSNFYPHLDLETIFSALKLPLISYINMYIFSWKLAI